MKEMETWDEKQVSDWLREDVFKPSEWERHSNKILEALNGVTGDSLMVLTEETIRNALSNASLNIALSTAFATRIINHRNNILNRMFTAVIDHVFLFCSCCFVL